MRGPVLVTVALVALAACGGRSGAGDAGTGDAGGGDAGGGADRDAGSGAERAGAVEGGDVSTSLTYGDLVLADVPVAFWTMQATATRETDLTGNGNDGTYQRGLPAAATMPNGDRS